MTDEFYWTSRACDGVNDCNNGQDEINCNSGRTIRTTARPITARPITTRPTTTLPTRPTTTRPITTFRPTTPYVPPTTAFPAGNQCCASFQIDDIQFSRVNNNFYISTDGIWKIEKLSRASRFSMTNNSRRVGFQSVNGFPVCPTDGKLTLDKLLSSLIIGKL